jgi:hypothetical protein
MHSSADASTAVPNAITPECLRRLNERDEPATAGEAGVAGTPVIAPLPGGGFGVFPVDQPPATGRPAGTFERHAEALIGAATYPLTGREAPYRLRTEPDEHGFAIESKNDWGRVIGHLTDFDQPWMESIAVLESLARAPEALALYLESVGGLALERAGAILAARLAATR